MRRGILTLLAFAWTGAATSIGPGLPPPSSQAVPGDTPGAPLAVTAVDPHGPAARAGLAVGDRVTAADGAPIRSAGALQERLARTRAGDTLRLDYLRQGKPGTATVRIERRYLPLPTFGRLGGSRIDLTADLRVSEEGGGKRFTVSGDHWMFLHIARRTRSGVRLTAPELRAARVAGSSDGIPGWRWYHFPRGAAFDLGEGIRLRGAIAGRAWWHFDPVSFFKPLGAAALPLETRPDRPGSMLHVRFGPPDLLGGEWPTRWTGWGMRVWDPELEAALGRTTTWEPWRYWGFACAGVPNGARTEGEPAPDVNAGPRIVALTRRSSLASAGLVAGDALIEIDGRRLASPWDLYRVMQRGFPGQKLRIAYLRGDERRETTVTLDDATASDLPHEYAKRRQAPPIPEERLAGATPEVRLPGRVLVSVDRLLFPNRVECVGSRVRVRELDPPPIQSPGRKPVRQLEIEIEGPVRLTAHNDDRLLVEVEAAGGVRARWSPPTDNGPVPQSAALSVELRDAAPAAAPRASSRQARPASAGRPVSNAKPVRRQRQ